jgi:hypothetical protein
MFRFVSAHWPMTYYPAKIPPRVALLHLSGCEYDVLVAIALHANRDGFAWPKASAEVLPPSSRTSMPPGLWPTPAGAPATHRPGIVRMLREGGSACRAHLPAGADMVRVRVLPDGRLDTGNSARHLGRSPKTLAQWRLNGIGPPSHKIGDRVFYYLDEHDTFIGSGDTERDPAGAAEDAADLQHPAEFKISPAQRLGRRGTSRPPGPNPPSARQPIPGNAA